MGRDAIDSAAALTDMGKYLFRERRLPVYDIAVAITKWVGFEVGPDGPCVLNSLCRFAPADFSARDFPYLTPYKPIHFTQDLLQELHLFTMSTRV